MIEKQSVLEEDVAVSLGISCEVYISQYINVMPSFSTGLWPPDEMKSGTATAKDKQRDTNGVNSVT